MLDVVWAGKGSRLSWAFWELEKRNGNFKREIHQAWGSPVWEEISRGKSSTDAELELWDYGPVRQS